MSLLYSFSPCHRPIFQAFLIWHLPILGTAQAPAYPSQMHPNYKVGDTLQTIKRCAKTPAAKCTSAVISYWILHTRCLSKEQKDLLFSVCLGGKNRIRTLLWTISLTESISAASSDGYRSTSDVPGSNTLLSMRTISLLSLHTSRRERLSTSRGAVQRPL